MVQLADNYGLKQVYLNTAVNKTGSSGRDMLLSFYRDFKTEMAQMMHDYMTDGNDMVINNIKVDADDKDGAVGQYLWAEWQSDINFVMERLMESLKFEDSLNKMVNNITM